MTSLHHPAALQNGIRSIPMPAGIHALHLFESDQAIKQHAAYAHAKAGGMQAALNLISDLALTQIYASRERFPRDCIFVAPHAKEASGDNAIPQVLAEVSAIVCGAESDKDIVQDVFVLVNAGRKKSLHPDKMTLKKLETRYANEINEIFGSALTANEAQYLVGFRTADEIRNRVVKAEQEIYLRLRSKGVSNLHPAQT